jgi:cell division protein FtsI (penicillin-binding protein 3)
MLYLYNNDSDLHPKVSEAPSPYTPVNIKGGHSDAVFTVSNELASFVGDDTNGADWCNTSVDVGGNVVVRGVDTDGIVPDVRNMGLGDALYLLESMDLYVTHEGAGRIVEQSIEAGTPIENSGGAIHLRLEI